MFLSCFTLMQIIPGLLSGYSFRLASVSYCHDPSFFKHLSHSLAQDVLGSPFLSPAPLRNQDVNARCAHQLRESLFPGPLCRWVRGCRWVMCMCVCKHTCLHLFILTDVKRRSLFNYIPLHLSYTLKTMSSPTPPTLIQCHRFPLISPFSVFMTLFSLQREPGPLWPLATPPHGYAVHLLTVTGVAKPYALKPYTGSLPPSHKAAALHGPTECLLI